MKRKSIIPILIFVVLIGAVIGGAFFVVHSLWEQQKNYALTECYLQKLQTESDMLKDMDELAQHQKLCTNANCTAYFDARISHAGKNFEDFDKQFDCPKIVEDILNGS